MSKTGIIIEREYLERVKKKSFIVTTILMPILMLALMAMPALIMHYADGSTARVRVIDNNGTFIDRLKDTKEVTFISDADSTSSGGEENAVLIIPADIIEDGCPLLLLSNGPSALSTETAITDQVNKIIETERLKQFNIANLDSIMNEVRASVAIDMIRTDKDSDDEVMSSGLSYGIGIGMAFILYMFLLIYGQMVMTSIIEEKSNRVLELVVSSVRPAQLMVGKIVGVALVAVTQMVLWGVLLTVMSAWILPAIIPAEAAADIAAVRAGQLGAVSDRSSIDIITALAAVTQTGQIVELIAIMTLFLILGFLIYSSIFASIGSAVDNIQDASQLTSFAIFPILFGIIFALIAAADPMGELAFWTSIFPLTSPMVMVARIPFGIPAWQICLSLVLLVAGFSGMIWIAGKIYRVGIFMYGKKPSFKEIIRWIAYK